MGMGYTDGFGLDPALQAMKNTYGFLEGTLFTGFRPLILNL